MLIEKGQLILIESEYYSDQRPLGMFRALQSFDIHTAQQDHLAALNQKYRAKPFVEYLLGMTLVEVVPILKIHIGEYNDPDIDIEKLEY